MKYSSLRLLVFPFLFFIFLIDSQLSTLFTTLCPLFCLTTEICICFIDDGEEEEYLDNEK